MRIDWSKVPKEIDGHPTRWVAMDERGTWFAYTVLPEEDDSVPGYGRWTYKSIVTHHWFAALGHDDSLQWAWSTPWDETLTAVSRGGTMTKGDLRVGMMARLRNGAVHQVEKGEDGEPFVLPFATDADGLYWLNDDLRDERRTSNDIIAVYDKPCWERDDKRAETLSKIAELEAKVAELRAMVE